jgi:hypothetical protein
VRIGGKVGVVAGGGRGIGASVADHRYPRYQLAFSPVMTGRELGASATSLHERGATQSN